MNIKAKFFIIGFFSACAFGIICAAGGLYILAQADNTMIFHDQVLPSGKSVKVTMCNLLWGSEHSERFPSQDCFGIEYVLSSPESTQKEKDHETMEVFELIRPLSEQWGITRASVTAFPSLKRKGIYYIYSMDRD